MDTPAKILYGMWAAVICIAVAFIYILTAPANAWSLKEAHNQANTTLVQVGDYCSGTVIDKQQGLVVTAAHCADDAVTTDWFDVTRPDGSVVKGHRTYFKPIEITIWNFDDQGNVTGSQKYSTEVVGASYPGDVAILHSIAASPFTNQVKISSTLTTFGAPVFTVGNPLMLLGAVAQGNVIKPQYVFANNRGDVTVIVFDCLMAPGSSGGGLFNDSGELIGLTNWARPGGPYLASPVQNVLDLLKALNLSVAA